MTLDIADVPLLDWWPVGTVLLVLLALAVLLAWLTRRWWRRAAVATAAVLVLVQVAVVVNAHYDYFRTIGEAFGVPASDVVSLREAESERGRIPAAGRVLPLDIPAVASRFAARPAVVYLPPAWFAEKRPTLPVIMLLHGEPGSPQDWVDGGQAQATADAWAAAHGGSAPVLVMPDVNGTYDGDSECVDSPAGNVETYLTEDVTASVTKSLGTRRTGAGWAVAGLSEGGSCALMLALRHPTLFGTFGDFSGLAGPRLGDTNADTQSTVAQLFGGSERTFAEHEPSALLARNRYPRLAGWFEVGDADPEPLAATRALVPAARAAGIATCQVVVPGGGHTFAVWSDAFARSLPWFAARLGPRGHPRPARPVGSSRRSPLPPHRNGASRVAERAGEHHAVPSRSGLSMSEEVIQVSDQQGQARTYPPDPELSRTANARPEMKEQGLEEFWDEQAKQRIDWFEPYDTVLEWNQPYAKWFVGGKLNACHNCVDRHVENGKGDKVALHAVPDDGPDSDATQDITFADLQKRVVTFANGLKKLGVGKGVPVGIYMQMIPDAVVAMLACARLGAPHTVVFGGFSGKAVAERCNDLGCTVLVTQDEALRGGKPFPQKVNADEGLDGGSTTIEKVVVFRRTGGDVPMGDRDVYADELCSDVSDDPAECPCEPMDAEDLLFLLYTSGSTGKPKGVVHTTGGYMTGVTTTRNLVFDVKEDSVYWCAADIGWITGHSYIVYGPLSNGVTSVLYEGVPGYPDKDVWWKIVEKYKVSILYTSPTAIRSHIKWGPEHAQKHDLSTIKILGSVGEPINPEVWEWYHEHIGGGKAPVMDTWWQTETGHILITPLPGITTLKPGSAQQPFPGLKFEVRDDEGNALGANQPGNLVLTRPWPGMMRGLYKDDERYRETYWSKYSDAYFAGDGAKFDDDGDLQLMGRIDDVTNVSGHRISTFEVESALVEHEKVAEAAVAARRDPDTGQAIVAFVSLKGGNEGDEELKQVLREHVAKQIGKLARPAELIFAPDLPKTRSGKIMRRLLKNIAEGEDLGDTSTLVDPSVVEDMKKQVGAS